MTSMVVVSIDSNCMAVGRYTRCLAGFSMGALDPAVAQQKHGGQLLWQPVNSRLNAHAAFPALDKLHPAIPTLKCILLLTAAHQVDCTCLAGHAAALRSTEKVCHSLQGVVATC
eukprot:GHUV01051239.1.p1 GENE.GHUV01051239.1~~GHUV01051239.1.p1  ORF type:complete len:114 (+),score=23.04 GHUV01051239.1:150-491(+)